MKIKLKNTIVLFLLFILLQISSACAAPMNSSLAKLIAAGQSVACSYEKNDQGGLQKGTFYVAQNKMRGDMEVSQPGEGTFPMHMIHEGDWTYTWGGPLGEKQGMKINTAAVQAKRGPHAQGPDLNEEISLDCQPWPVDASKFNPPADVQFNELGWGMLGTPSAAGGMDMQALRCSACDQAPPDARDQCRQALGC